MRLTIQAGTITTYKDGSETTENIYYQNVDELMKEFEKQKSEITNPKITENEITKFAEKSQDSKRIQKLGQYEDIDENPEHLAKVSKALEIIKEKKVNVSLLFNTNNYLDYNDHVCRAQIYLRSNAECLTKEEYNLLKEVLL